MTIGVKVPSALTKTECLNELKNFNVATSPDMTLQELRSLVKKARIEEGLMSDRKNSTPTLMSKIERASLTDLKAMASDLKISYPPRIEHGAMRLHMRQWLLRNGSPETIVTFGKHSGSTFQKIEETDHQYLEWSVQEASNKPNAGWGLVQLAMWAILSGKVPDPFDATMHITNANDKSLPPTSLAAIMELDDSMFSVTPVDQKSAKTPVLSLKGGAAASSSTAVESNEELLKQVAMLRQEIRALKESQGQEVSPRSRKSPKE